jgi:hypothetical protein
MLDAALGMNPPSLLQACCKVVFDRLGRDVRQRKASERRAEELQGVGILLMRAFAAKRRL